MGRIASLNPVKDVNILGKLGDCTKNSPVALVTLLQDVLNDILPDLCFFVEFKDPDDYPVCIF
jgi:hypothetical protein